MDSCCFHENDFDAELCSDGFALVFASANVAHLVEATLAVARMAFDAFVEDVEQTMGTKECGQSKDGNERYVLSYSRDRSYTPCVAGYLLIAGTTFKFFFQHVW